MRRVETRYFWIIGDDDLPKRGVVGRLVELLRSRSPALVYMQSEWVNPVTDVDQGERVGVLRAESLDALTFARRVHVWLTFLSAVIIDRHELDRALQGQSIDRHQGSVMIQLGWILPLLRTGREFIFVTDRCVLATKDNTGGYPLLTVFCVNFPSIAEIEFGARSPLARALVDGAVARYLPGLVWDARRARNSRHDAEDAWPAIRRQLGHHALFWALLLPLARLPRGLADVVFQGWRVCNRLARELGRLRRFFSAARP